MIVGLSAMFFILYGSFVDYYGGQNPGPRYLYPLIPLWFLVLGPLIDGEWRNRTFRFTWWALAFVGLTFNGYEAVCDYTQSRSAGQLAGRLLCPWLDDGMPAWEINQMFIGWWPTLFHTPGVKPVAIAVFIGIAFGAFILLRQAWKHCDSLESRGGFFSERPS